jgi:hypothetical protein
MVHAFPTDEYYNETRVGQYEGMELRDFFAAHAAAGYLAASSSSQQAWSTPAEFAKEVYEIADALLKARKKRVTKESTNG